MTHDVFLRLPQSRRDEILNASKDEFNTYGFENAKVTRICEKANLKRPTFYSYFDSLDDIYNLLFEGEQSSCKDIFSGGEIIKILTDDTFDLDKFKAFEEYFSSMIESKTGIKKLYKSIAENDFEARMVLNIFISLFMQYELKLITAETMLDEVKKAATYFTS